MQVKEIMTRDVEMINSDAKLPEVARKMKELEVGALPIWEDEELVGIITDRDIVVRVIAEGKDLLNTPVSEIMTPEVFYCLENDDLYEAAKIMEEESIHRLLVLSNDGEPIGFVSLADFSVKCHDEHLVCEVLERISGPACPHR